MAVEIEQQRRGIGTLLLNRLEDTAVELGATRILLDAREQALGFYRKQGYKLEGPGHTLFNSIAHVKMRKDFA
jgi:ribosomal protein S18 acetylase RimI-like enzyme